jgi:arginase family enzyme
VAAAARRHRRLLLLGGDHSLTYPALRAVAAAYPPLTILQLDAHPDLYDSFEGDPLSHACPFARILEEGLCRRLIQVGLRNVNAHQRRQAERFGVEQLTMRDLDTVIDFRLDGPVYLSFDLEALELLRRWSPTVVAADLVELNPRRDPSGITAALAAKLVKEIAGTMQRSSTPRSSNPVAAVP